MNPRRWLPDPTTVPWLAAITFGGLVHAGWLVHEVLEADAPPKVVVMPAIASPSPSPSPVATACPPAQPVAAACDAVAAEPPWRPAPAEVVGDAGGEAVVCEGDDACVIHRDHLMSNPMMWAKMGRFVPSVRDGVQVGFKIYGIRDGSIARQMGFKNGDLVTEVGGVALTSVDVAMEFALRLRGAADGSTMSISLVRDGAPLRKTFTLW